jgi:hypothetical protein
VVKGGKIPVIAQLGIIVAAFVIVVLIVTFVLTKLDEPTHTPPASSGTADQ